MTVYTIRSRFLYESEAEVNAVVHNMRHMGFDVVRIDLPDIAKGAVPLREREVGKHPGLAMPYGKQEASRLYRNFIPDNPPVVCGVDPYKMSDDEAVYLRLHNAMNEKYKKDAARANASAMAWGYVPMFAEYFAVALLIALFIAAWVVTP